MAEVLKKAKPPKPNMSYRQRSVVRALRNDSNIVIVPADKGKATVVMDRMDYDTKMSAILQDDQYRPLPRDPTVKVENKIVDTLKRLRNEGHLDHELYDFLTPRYSTPPQMYGLPKIHKEDTPMRPIVSTINSPTYKLAKELARILTPLAGNTAYTVKNSTAFVERIRGVQTTPQDTLVSFDVKSLFTQVPVEAALTVVEDRLCKDPTLGDRSSIPVPQLVELTRLCLRSTYFQLGDKFYEQTDGAAMGSPLSPVIANLYLESLEETAILSAPFKPKLWVRYVDDTFVIWTHGPDRLQSFHQHLNKQHPKIQFTVEEEKDDQLPFLDVLVTKEGRRLLTSVYRKPTHTERYIPYHSHHHPRATTGVLRCMRDRARNICHPSKIQQEMDHLNQVFQANGFPENLVKKTLTTLPSPLPGTTDSQQQPEDAPKILCTPYIRGLSEKIEKVCAPLGVKPVFRPKKTLKKELMQVKNRTPEQKQTGVVYEIPCKDCPEVYVGETKRTLKVRLSEHKQAVKRGDPKNGIAVHVHKTNHCINWDGATVQRRAEGFWQRRTVEAIQ
ncbi:MAG: reverse transcriptase domain-containing protein, partial [Alphaproteobacteria bacterium]|nr:reverse transcriptase domain-containing protein [Alphaproteobacteria bacterium]